ncbi:MAG: IclR family transcriptional regulator, acetate operon repressor [Clostridia bacterium]|nr:IclR family transcriptional regulator, acetate operon repressor [Clostridia bacterium]
MSNTNDKKTQGVQSVDRAISILEVMAREGSPMTLSNISLELKLNISTVHRLLSSLINHGLVEQDPYQGKYKLGIKAFEIGNRALYSLDIRSIVRPFLHQLVDDFNETTSLSIFDKHEVVYIDQVESKRLIKILARPGTRAPAYCTGAGKVFLAYISETDLENYIKEVPLLPYTASTITDPNHLREELKKIRSQGFAIDQGEREEEVRCIAAPLLNHENKIIAAISVSGPIKRMSHEINSSKLATAIVQVTHQLTQQLRYHRGL